MCFLLLYLSCSIRWSLFSPNCQIFDGHNGNAAAIYTRENLLNHILGAIPRDLGREEWLQALPRALVAGFVKTDKEFQSRGMGLFTPILQFFFLILSRFPFCAFR